MTTDEAETVSHAEPGPRQAIPGYQLLSKLGKGAIGSVYKARQISLDRMVAIKVLHPALARQPQFAERFVEEARTLARLAHPNIVTPFDVGLTGRFYFLVMEYMDGKTVAQLLGRGGSLDEKRTLGIVYQVALALEHVAEHEMVHRDVKPHNIILSKAGAAKLCDLGFAVLRAVLVGPEGTTGTPHYISPEQARGEELDIRSDLYSLGATLYQMMTGRTPFEGADAGALIAKHLDARPAPPQRVRPEMHPDTARLIERLMEKRRERRPSRPREVAKEIERILTDMGVSPYDTSVRPQRGPEAPPRRASDPSVRAYRGTLDPSWPRNVVDTSVPSPIKPPPTTTPAVPPPLPPEPAAPKARPPFRGMAASGRHKRRRRRV